VPEDIVQPTAVPKDEGAILEYLKQVAREQLNMTPEQIESIKVDAPLMEALPLDSLNQVILVSTIERDFGQTFEPEQWQALATVQDLVKMIAGEQAAA
jgi:acyl carrier protein